MSIIWRYVDHYDVANVTSGDHNGVDAIVTESLLLYEHIMQSIALSYDTEPTYPIHIFS